MSDTKTQNEAAENRPIPSQAEGSDTAESDSGERPVPSQAEGDEETVEESLRQKGGQ